MTLSRRGFNAFLGTSALMALAAPLAAYPKPDNVLRFATWNMAGAAPQYFGRGLAGITQWIKDNGVDVCALQEVDRFSEKSGYVDFPAYMAQKTGFDAYFAPSSIETWRPNNGHPYREYGNALLSRFPLRETFTAALSAGPHAPEHIEEWGQDKRVAVFGRIEVSGQDTWIAGTHLSSTVSPYTPVVRHFQSLNLMETARERIPETAPFLLGGDFNTMAGTMDLYPIHQEMECHTRFIGPTWPLNHTRPVQELYVTLDHLFTRAVSGTNVRVFPLAQLSDHALVVMDVALPHP